MLIEKLKEIDIANLKKHYGDWLNSQNLSPNTISTSKVDAFYILKHNPDFDFWGLLLDDDFELKARMIFKETLAKNSKGDIASNINGYLAHLRRFRKFALSDTDLQYDKTDTVSPNTPKLHSENTAFIPTPCFDEVEKYLRHWDELENYRLQENALNKLFNELAPNNDDISDILLKSATLNDFYSTNIYSIYPVAKHIKFLHIDKRLRNGDPTLVDDIKTVTIGGKVKQLYSFATKYCSHHNAIDYPIYDSYVDEVLRHFRKVDSFTVFKNDDLKDYPKFKDILISFRTYYNLNDYSLKQLDQYLWLLGKKYLPKNYNSK